jgi:hypothetical protein
MLYIYHSEQVYAHPYCNVHNYGFGLGRNYTVVLRAIHPHNRENPQTAKRVVKSPYFTVIVPLSTVKVSTLYLILLNYSHSRNPPCAPARTHGQIQAPREPPN